jgi:hypothetical protein
MKIVSNLLILFSLALAIPAFSQDKLKQEVTVTAVEVPVRVLQKNQIVKGLTRADFEVLENGVKQDITGFEIVSRKISGAPRQAPGSEMTKLKPRFFILIFNIFDYNEAVGEAIDYFFQNVFREKDKLVIITENRLLNFNTLDKTGEIVRGLKETLKRFKVISRQNITRAYFKLKSEGDTVLNMLQGVGGLPQPQSWEDQVIRFYDNYLQIWKSYRSQFLTPDTNLYEGLIKRIAVIDADRWALCFQQRDLFPVLKNEGRLEQEINQLQSRRVQNKQRDLQQELDLSKNFPSDKLNNLFMGCGIAFHLILMKPIRTLGDEDFELKEVAQDYEDCFREISRSTGGYWAFSNKALEALKGAAEKEDYYYLLVYQPKGPLETRGKNIEVRVRQEGSKVYNLKQYSKLGGPVITIADVDAVHQTLKFVLEKYIIANTEKGKRGIVEVHVTLFDEQSNMVFSEGRVLDSVKDKIHATLNLDKLKPGPYLLILDALDKLTNEKDVYTRIIEL